MKKYLDRSSLKVPEVALLFLCKTATKKTLYIEFCTVFLECEIDEELHQCFHSDCENEQDAKDLEFNCVEALNY